MKCTRLFLSLVVAVAMVVGVSGCPGERTARLSGTVKYQNKPLTGGTVIFAVLSESNEIVKAERCEIDPATGAYSCARVPWPSSGKIAIAVEPAQKSPGSFMPKDAKGPPKDSDGAGNYSKQAAGAYVNIPQTLRDARTSNLFVTIDSSDKTHNIDLPDVKQ
jgi:hypothetical protein